nr:hypothetical protein [Halomonas zhangzhouensis]
MVMGPGMFRTGGPMLVKMIRVVSDMLRRARCGWSRSQQALGLAQ